MQLLLDHSTPNTQKKNSGDEENASFDRHELLEPAIDQEDAAN